MQKRTLHCIWQVPVFLPYRQPPLTDDALANAEKRIGYKLPGKYIELLKIQNGGYIRCKALKGLNEVIYGIGPYFPSITDFDWADEDVSFELNGLVPFDGDGHWHLCLDYRKNKIDPEITFISLESEIEDTVAESFDQYVELLELDTEGEYVIETDLGIEQMVDEIQQLLKIDFTGPDYYASGYPIYRGNSNGNLVWVSPNEVPKGFVREDDARYEELKKEMEGTTLRYPEVPASSLFIQVSDEKERATLFKSLTDNSFKIMSLKEIIQSS